MSSPSESIHDEALVEAQGVGKIVQMDSGSLTILEGVNLKVCRGESQAIVGVSGSGKSTLLGLLAALDRPTSGRVMLCGCDTLQMNEAQAAELRRKHTAFVFQSFQLLDELTALENIVLPLELRGIRKGALEQGWEALEAVQLQNRANHYPRQLSGGEQQRVALARAYAQKPDVLYADEPTGNLDRRTGERVRELMFDLVQRSGMALLLVTHDEALAESCDQVFRLSVSSTP